MPTYNDYGIILKSFDLSETDKILNIYTKANGLVRAVAKGAKKTTSKVSGKVDQLFCSYFQFAKGKKLDTICDIEQVTSFPKLRSDPSRLFFGILFLDIVNSFAHEGESESTEIYDLLYFSLNELQTTSNPEFVTLTFILNFLSIHGFKPQFDTCVSCSKNIGKAEKDNRNRTNLKPKIGYAYSSTLGGLLCNECLNIEHKVIPGEVINLLTTATKSTNADLLRPLLKLLQDHLNARSKKEIKSFDLVFSL